MRGHAQVASAAECEGGGCIVAGRVGAACPCCCIMLRGPVPLLLLLLPVCIMLQVFLAWSGFTLDALTPSQIAKHSES